MLDDRFDFQIIEYDDRGETIRQGIESVPREDPAGGLVERLAASEDELKEMGASITGAKSVPDNTNSFLIFFRMKVDAWEPAQRRFIPVWEVEKPWRRGWGITTWDGAGLVRVYGLWFPWRRPKKPKVEVFTDHQAMNVSPSELLGPR